MTEPVFFGIEEEEDTSTRVSGPQFFDSEEEEDVSALSDTVPKGRPQGDSPIPLVSDEEAKAKGEMGITETAQKSYEAATGVEAPENPILAQLANMGVALGGRLHSEIQMKAAQDLAAGGNYSEEDIERKMDQMIWGGVADLNEAMSSVPSVVGPGAMVTMHFHRKQERPRNSVMKMWDEAYGKDYQDPEERRIAKMKYAGEIATALIKERSAVRENAETELRNREATHSANIVTHGLGMVGYTLPYMLGPVGIALHFAEEGSANTLGNANDKFGYDENGKFRLVSKGDSLGRAAVAGFGSAGIETAAEVVGGKVGGAVLKRGAKVLGAGAGRALGATVGKFPVLRKAGHAAGKAAGEALEKFETTKVGAAVAGFGRSLNNAFKWTSKKFHIENPIEENIEEWESASLNAITGWDRRESELGQMYDDEGNKIEGPWARFLEANKEFFKPSNVLALNEAMLLVMGGGSFVGMCQRRGAMKDVDNMIRENKLLSEEELRGADLEKKAAALDAWAQGLNEEQTLAKINAATGWTDKLADKIKGESGKFAGEVNALREKMRAAHDYNTGKELDELRLPRQKFNMPWSRDEKGKPVPEFKTVITVNTETGETFKRNAVYDESGISIVDNAEKGDSAYTVYDAYGKNIGEYATIPQAITRATGAKNDMLLDRAKDEMKRRVIENVVEKDFKGANILAVKTMDEALEASMKMTGEDVAADKNFNRRKKGWKLKDGTIILVRDNIKTPADVETTIRHEAIGHSEEAMSVDFRGEALFGQEQIAERMRGFVKKGYSPRQALREAVAIEIQKRRHAPDAVDKIFHGVRELIRKTGLNLKMSDADFEVEVAEIEKRIRKGDGNFISKEAAPLGPQGYAKAHQEAAGEAADVETDKEMSVAPEASVGENDAVLDVRDEFRKRFIDKEYAFEEDRAIFERGTDEELAEMNAAYDKMVDASAESAEGERQRFDEVASRIRTRIKTDEETASKAAGVKTMERVSDLKSYIEAKSDLSEAERASLDDAVAKVANADDMMKLGDGDRMLDTLLRHGALMLIKPNKTDKSDKNVPNFKLDVNPETGIKEPLAGKWMPSLAGFGVVWMKKDGTLVQGTGRHRSNKADEADAPMWNVVLREADGWDKGKISLIDGTFNIKDEKGSIADYVRFFEDSGFERGDAEENGLLKGKGLDAWSIYADATPATRDATDVAGTGEDGKITVEQAVAIAQAAPKGADKKNAAIQSALVRAAKGGMRGQKFVGYCREMARSLREGKIGENLLVGEQMDLFADETFLAMEKLAERRSEYRAKRSNSYVEIARSLRSAVNNGQKLNITEAFAKDLGITDKTDKVQLQKALETAQERAEYWDPTGERILDQADVIEMDSAINAKADAKALKLAELKAKRDAIKAGKPLPKKLKAEKRKTETPKAVEAKETPKREGGQIIFGTVTDKGIRVDATIGGAKKPVEKDVPAPRPAKKTIVMKDADAEKRAKSVLDDIDFMTDAGERREKQGELSGETSLDQVPAGDTYGKKWRIFKPGTRNADIGAGKFNKATAFLKEIGVANIAFDPVNRSRSENVSAVESIKKSPADTATVNNVLNVIDNDAVLDGIINQAARAIKPTGTAIFTIYEGKKNGVGAKTSKGWQRNAPAADYVPRIGKYFGSVERHGNIIVAKQPKDVGTAFWAFDSKFEEGIDFMTEVPGEEFDYEKFGRLVSGVGKLVGILQQNGYNTFGDLANYIYETDPAKFAKAEGVLQDVWNAAAKAKNLSRVSDDEAQGVFDIIHKRKEETDGGSLGQPGPVDGTGDNTLGGEQPGADVRTVEGEEARTDGAQDGEVGSGDGVQVGRSVPRHGVGVRAGTDTDGGRGDHESGDAAAGGSARKTSGEGSVSDERAGGAPRVDTSAGGGSDERGDFNASRASGGESPVRLEPKQGVKKRAVKAAAKTKVAPAYPDFVMTEAVEKAILEKNVQKRLQNNLAAIKLIQSKAGVEDWHATPEEQATLAKYVGWGGLADMFDPNYDRAWSIEKDGNGGSDTQTYYIRRAKFGKDGWEVYKELRSTLNEEEYKSARASTTTAFYTPIPMVRLEHDALRALGVKGGRFLGPSAGVGNYASAAGEYEKGASWQFVEKDQLSGKILKALFPNQRVNIMGFEETKFPDGFFDFTIDNVPYADFSISDRVLSSHKMKIHDYFFAKALSKLRPGGVMMFLTSTGTLDKTNPVLRQYLSEHGGQFLGAVRLPNGFFSDNAGTDVAADLVVIQKKDGAVDNTAFERQHEYAATEDEHWDRKKREWTKDKKPLTYNGYFHDHPEQIVGKMEVGTNQFGPCLKYSMPEGDVFAEVRQALDRVLGNVDTGSLLKSATVAEKKPAAPMYDDEGLRQGNITMKDGKCYIKSGDMLEPVALPNDRALSKELAKRFKNAKTIVMGMMKLRKAMRDVIDAQMRGCADEELKPLLDTLNVEYDTFKAKNGSLHDKWVTPFVMLDKADGNRLMALERIGKDKAYSKADIFTKRVISLGEAAKHAETPRDALIVSYSESGTINPERIAQLLDTDVESAIEALKENGDVFENPETGRIEPSWEYLSGKVRAKLAAARAAVEAGDESFRKNIEELEKIQPPTVKLEDADIKFGATWAIGIESEVPAPYGGTRKVNMMEAFLRDAFGSEKMELSLKKNEVTGHWDVNVGRAMNADPWGETSWSTQEFINRVLNHGSMNHFDKDPIDGKKYLNERRTEANKLAKEKLHQAFGDFIRQSDVWSPLAFDRYNAVMTDFVGIKLPNNILPFKAAGMSDAVLNKLFENGDMNVPKKGREYQAAVISRGVLGGSSMCLAHCVGAGKTLEMQSIGMLGRHLGMFRKSMYVVPNHMLNQFCNEFTEAFPNANILKMTEEDVKPANRRAFFAQCANGDWDAIVVKHSTFSKKLGMSAEYQKKYAEEQLKNLELAIEAMRDDGDRISVKNAEKMKERLETKLKDLQNEESKDKEIVAFEELGVDQLFVDEAHNFKGLPITTKQGRIGGLAQGDSQRAVDMEMKTQYVQSLHGGKRGVVFATGTPLSNAPVVESYVFLKYLAPQKLREQGLSHFDDFVDAFGQITTESEFSVDGKTVKEKDKISAFVNIPELMKLYKSVVDIVNSDQLDIQRPTPKYEMIDVDMTPAQEAVMEAVASQANTPGGKEWQSKYMDLTWVAKYACISPKMLGINEIGGKIVRCVEEVKKVYDETSDEKGTQLIFGDRFNIGYQGALQRLLTEAGKGIDTETISTFDLNSEIKNMLVERGIPADEIAVIQDLDKMKGDKDQNKEALFAKVRSGQIRVLIGSRPKMGEGTNVQERLAAIHLLHPGWKPAEDEQAIGRIIRYGNTFKTGRIFYYLTRGNNRIGSYETKNHQLIGVKSNLINQVMHGDETVRVIEMDESAMDREMLMGLASGNKALMELVKVRKEVRKLDLNTESTMRSARNIKMKAEANARDIERQREEWIGIQEGIKAWNEANEGKPFELSVLDGRVFDKAKDMADYIASEMAKELAKDKWDRNESTIIGNFNGIPLVLAFDYGTEKFRIAVKELGIAREMAYTGFLADFNQQAMGAFKGRLLDAASPEYVKAMEASLADKDKQAKKMAADADKLEADWKQMSEKLGRLRIRQVELEREVTPLVVKATEDKKRIVYGNWIIGRPLKDGDFIAQRESDLKRIEARTVKELLPLMDKEDFAAPSKGTTKTLELERYLKPDSDGRFPIVQTFEPEKVDFMTDDVLDTPDFKAERRFDVVENGKFHPNHVGGFSRKQANAYVRKLYGPTAVAYELGAWQKHNQNAIMAHRERQIGAINRQYPRAVAKSGTVLPVSVRLGFFDDVSKSKSLLTLSAAAPGYRQNSERARAYVEADLFGEQGHTVNGWTYYADGTVLVPLTGQRKHAVRNIIALNHVFPNTWQIEGFGSHNGKDYALVKTDMIGSPFAADESVKHDFLASNGFARSEYMAAVGKDYWVKDGIGVDVKELVLGKTSDGRTFAYNVPAGIRVPEISYGKAEIDFMTDGELSEEERTYAESDDKTPTEAVSREVFGMTNDEIALELRAAKMDPPKHKKKTDAELWQQAEILLSNDGYMSKLSRAVYKVGRPVSDYENVALNILFRNRQEEVNQLQELYDDIASTPDDVAATDPDFARMLKEAKADLDEARSLMYETGVAAMQAASRQGAALRSNRVLLDKNDFSFAGILGVIQRDAKTGDISADMMSRIKDLAADFAQLNDEEGKEIYSARLKAFSEKVVKDIKSGGKMRRASENHVGDEARRVHRNYFDAMAQVEVHAAEAGGALIGLSDQMYPSWGRWLKYIGEYHCFMNPEISEADCIKAIVEDVSKFVEGIDEDQVRDMLTGFGHNYRQSKYDSQRLMNDLKAQARLKRQLDYMNEHNALPPATGMVRDDPSQTTRELQREVSERKKEVDETYGGANRLKGALQSAKTRMKNRIEDLEKAIESGVAIKRANSAIVEDEELKQLRSRRDSLQSIYDGIFKTEKGLTDEQRAKLAEKALSRELARVMEDYARAMSGDFSKRAKRPVVNTMTAQALRQQIQNTRDMILDLKKASYEFGLTPEEIESRHARKMAAREQALLRMAERIEKGDLRPNIKPQPPMPEELQKRYDEMGRQLKRAHQKLADMRLEAENSTIPSFWRKGAAYAKFATAAQRALRATLDFSAVLRQAARITLAHPKMAVKAFGRALTAMKSDVRLQEVNDEIMSDKAIQEAANRYGLHLRAVDAADGRDVEMFHGMERNRIKIFGKDYAVTDIPFFGELMLKSERHYITYLNAVSAELYTAIINDSGRFPGGATPFQKRIVCDMINMWNGSGALSKERRAAMQKSFMNEIFWAPGLAISRMQTAVGYDIWHSLTAKGEKNAQGEMEKPSKAERVTMAKLGASEHIKSTMAMLALGALMKWLFSDDDDEYKLSQADWFEKMLMLVSPRIGKTSIDLTGGESSFYRTLYQIAKKEKVSNSGRTQKFGEFAGPSTVGTIQRFMQGKWSPWLSELTSMWEGKDYVGQDFTWRNMVLNAVVPLTFEDMYDQVTENGVGLSLITIPATLLGAGGSTYDRKPYENAVNPFMEAYKEYSAIENDEALDEADREAMLMNIRESNKLMRDEVREDIAQDIAQIRRDENRAKRNEKRDGEPDTEYLMQIEHDKKALLEKIRRLR